MKLGSNCLCPRIGLVLLAYALAQGFWLLVLTHLRDKCAVEEAKMPAEIKNNSYAS